MNKIIIAAGVILLAVIIPTIILKINFPAAISGKNVNGNSAANSRVGQDFPVYPKAHATISDTQNPKKPVYQWQTDSPIKPVMVWYKTELVKSGWLITIPPAPGNPYQDQVDGLEARKADRILQLTLTRNSQATKIIAEFPDPSMFDEEEEEGK
jgi:hypothetical protein